MIHLADLHQRDPETGRQLPDYANPDLRHALLAIALGRGGMDSAGSGCEAEGRVVTLEVAAGKRERVRFETLGVTHGGVARWRLSPVPSR